MYEILIKSFYRRNCLKRCIRSIRDYYPNTTIRICDDSNIRPITGKNIHWYKLPHYSGLAVGKNFLRNLVETPYFVHVDDDMIFTEETNLDKMLLVANKTAPSIVGGYIKEEDGIRHGPGDVSVQYNELEGRVLTRRYYGNKAPSTVINNIRCIPCRCLPSFIMGNKNTFYHYNIHWRDELKRCDHIPFYLDLPKEIACYAIPSVTINHRPENSKEYKSFKDNDLYKRMVGERKTVYETIYQ